MKKRFATLLAAFTLFISTTGAAQMSNEANIKTAIFAGGCFWCMEKPFEQIDGVIEAKSGYTGGHVDNPSYEEVSAGNSGHYEAVKITYDANKVNYQTLLDTFWVNVDPIDATGQFCDKGSQYRAAIFYQNDEEKALAEASKEKVAEKLASAVATGIVKASTFYDAEEYHQNYYKKNPIRYHFFRSRCGRDSRLEQLWGEK